MNPFATDIFVQTHIEDLHREAAERRLARQVPRHAGAIRAAWQATAAAVTTRVRAVAGPENVSTAQPVCCPA